MGSVAAQRQPTRQAGVIASLITLPFQLFGVLCGALLLSILIECIGMHFFWRNESWHHAQGMLDYELDQLSSYFRESLLIEEPGRTTHRWIAELYDMLFVKTGLLDWIEETSTHARADTQGPRHFRYFLRRTNLHVESYAIAAGYVVLTFLVRLVVLCLTLPLFLMAVLVGLIDGTARRDIRRFGAGRESSFIYHRAKASVIPLSLLPWMIYLAMPVSVHPLWILLPSAILLSIAVNITAGSFKKYL